MMMEMLARKHFERGRQFELQDRTKDAMAAYEKACELKPDDAAPFLALGRMKAARGQLRDALELLDEAAERSDDPQILQWRGYVNGRLRRFEDALADYQDLAHLEDPHIEVNVGRMLLALGRYDEAEEALSGIEDPAGKQLYEALPRYREFDGESTDDVRAVRYLFGGSVVLGSLGDGGLKLRGDRYQLLEYRHLAFTIRRLKAFVDRHDWGFDGVAGRGPHHLPIVHAVASVLGLPVLSVPEASARVLICSAVVKGPTESAGITRPWRDVGATVMHFAMGLVPTGDPNEVEPDLIGFVGRCAVPWYRVEAYTRLETDPEGGLDSQWPGFKVGPPFVDPNSERVAAELVAACTEDETDPLVHLVLDWYERHSRVRAFGWSEDA